MARGKIISRKGNRMQLPPRLGSCVAGVLLSAWSVTAIQPTQPPAPAAVSGIDEIITVEREFAQDSVKNGVKQSFLRYVAPDGVIFRPRPVPAAETLRQDPDDNVSEGFLDWWPTMAGVARSGDLGFSLGPWHQHVNAAAGDTPPDTYGYYCTIWRRQPDGRWKFVIDGAGAFLRTTAPTRSRATTIVRLPVADEPRAVSADAAFAEVRTLELDLTNHSRENARVALPRYYAADAWVMGSPVEVQPGASGWEAELSRRPSRLTLQHVGGGASSAGDLVYTYGLVDSAEPGVTLRDATYLHIWMRRAGTWRIVFDGVKQRRSFQ